MRFKKDKFGDWKIEVKYGPKGQQRRHIGLAEGRKIDGQVYADVYLNYNSVAQVHRFVFLQSERAAKQWVREQINEEEA